MVANAHHECKERRAMKANIVADVPIRIPSRWVVMVVTDRDNNVDMEVPVKFCPWCGLELEWAYKENHPKIQKFYKEV